MSHFLLLLLALSSFICLFIFLTLQFCFIFFTFPSRLPISSLISNALAMAYTASVFSDWKFLSLGWFAMILLALCSISSLSFTFIILSFPQNHLLLLSLLPSFVLRTALLGLYLLSFLPSLGLYLPLSCRHFIVRRLNSGLTLIPSSFQPFQ